MNILLRFFHNGTSSSTSWRVFIDARILDLILEGRSDEYEPIRFTGERDPELLLNEIEITMRNMCANHVAPGDGSPLSRRKGRQSVMTASSGFKGSFDYCYSPGHKKV